MAINKVETNMIMLRRNEKDFLARKGLKYLDKFNANYAKLEQRISNLSDSMEKAQLDTSQTVELLIVFSHYAESFTAPVNLKKRIGLNNAALMHCA